MHTVFSFLALGFVFYGTGPIPNIHGPHVIFPDTCVSDAGNFVYCVTTGRSGFPAFSFSFSLFPLSGKCSLWSFVFFRHPGIVHALVHYFVPQLLYGRVLRRVSIFFPAGTRLVTQAMTSQAEPRSWLFSVRVCTLIGLFSFWCLQEGSGRRYRASCLPTLLSSKTVKWILKASFLLTACCTEFLRGGVFIFG